MRAIINPYPGGSAAGVRRVSSMERADSRPPGSDVAGRHVLHVVGDSGFGGGARVVLALAQGAQQSGYQVHILTTNERFAGLAMSQGVAPVGGCLIRSSISPLSDLKAVASLYVILRRTRYDVVHTHTSKAGIIGRIAAKLAGVPVIVHTMHGFPYKDTSRSSIKRLAHRIEVAASHWCDALVTVAHYQGTELLDAGVSARGVLHVIPNGVPDPASSRQSEEHDIRSEFSVASHEQLVVCHGRLAANKGIETLLLSLSELLATGRRMRCLIIGDGPLESALKEQAAQLGILNNGVTFTGFRSDIAEIIAASDIVVLPTYREGLSIALLEAMAAAKPIITTNIPANTEGAGGEAAVLVPAGDSAALATSLAALLDCPSERGRLAIAARTRYEAYYTETRMVTSYLALYRQLQVAP